MVAEVHIFTMYSVRSKTTKNTQNCKLQTKLTQGHQTRGPLYVNLYSDEFWLLARKSFDFFLIPSAVRCSHTKN